MPKDKFYFRIDSQTPDIEVGWSAADKSYNKDTRKTTFLFPGQVLINGDYVNRETLDRLIKVLTKARKQAYAKPESSGPHIHFEAQ